LTSSGKTFGKAALPTYQYILTDLVRKSEGNNTSPLGGSPMGVEEDGFERAANSAAQP